MALSCDFDSNRYDFLLNTHTVPWSIEHIYTCCKLNCSRCVLMRSSTVCHWYTFICRENCQRPRLNESRNSMEHFPQRKKLKLIVVLKRLVIDSFVRIFLLVFLISFPLVVRQIGILYIHNDSPSRWPSTCANAMCAVCVCVCTRPMCRHER